MQKLKLNSQSVNKIVSLMLQDKFIKETLIS